MSKLTPSLLLLATLLSACNAQQKTDAPAKTGKEMPPPEVDVVTVQRSDATLTQDLPGRVQAIRSAQVHARVDGIVEKRLFNEGTDVAAGTALFQINERIYRVAYDAARADWAIARQTVERYKTLIESKAVSQQDLDLALAKEKQAQAAVVRAEEDMNNARVPAPLAGHIGRALVTEGALVTKNEGTLLATIDQLDPIYVNFTQSNSDLLRLKQAIKNGKMKRSDAHQVELLLEDGSVYPHKGQIIFTDLTVDANTGAISVRAQFANPQRELLPGMFTRVRFPQAVVENTFRVPQRAVITGAQGQSVMSIGPENKVTPLPIKTSGMSGTDFIVSDGLKGGEQIIVNGLQKAKPGTVVKISAPAKGTP